MVSQCEFFRVEKYERRKLEERRRLKDLVSTPFNNEKIYNCEIVDKKLSKADLGCIPGLF